MPSRVRRSISLACDHQDMPRGQCLGNSANRHTIKEKPEDEPYILGLLLIDGEIAVLSLIVAEKTRAADGELAVCEYLPQTPCDVLGNAPLLCPC